MSSNEMFSDVAIIFRRTIPKKGEAKVLLKPIACKYCDKLEGKLSIIANDNICYNHLLSDTVGDVYGLRIGIDVLKTTFNTNSVIVAKKKYFDYVKNYLFSFCYNDEIGLCLYGVNKKEELVIDDQDILEYVKVVNNDSKGDDKDNKNFEIRDICDKLKERVIGQDRAIEKLVTTLWINEKLKERGSFAENKLNILLVGNSGVGKTLMVTTLGKLLNKTVYMTSADSLSETGYVGNSVTDILSGLLAYCNNDIDKASNAIVFLDEFDKLSINSGGQISTESVQQELLTVLEGGDFLLRKSADSEDEINFSTKNITFICAGAFSGMNENKVNTVGFIKDTKGKKNNTTIGKDDIEEYGFIPELVGRLPVIIELSKLDKNNLIDILKSNSDLLTNIKNIIEKENIELVIGDEVYEVMADQAISNRGARELRTIIMQTFFGILNDISIKNIKYKKIIITKETVMDPYKFDYELVEDINKEHKKIRKMNK